MHIILQSKQAQTQQGIHFQGFSRNSLKTNEKLKKLIYNGMEIYCRFIFLLFFPPISMDGIV